MELWTLDPNLHLSAQDTLFCLITCLFAPFICLARFVFPRLALFVSVFLACSPFFPCFFLFSLHVHPWSMDTQSKGVTSQAQAKKARMHARRCKPTKGNVQQIKGPIPYKAVFSFFLFLSLFSRSCIKVPPLLVPIYFSYSLLVPHSLGMAMSILHFLYLAG